MDSFGIPGLDILLHPGGRFRVQGQNRFRYLNSVVAVRSAVDLTGRASNTFNTLAWDTDIFDTDGLHDTGANTSRLTAAITGKYLISGGIQVISDTALVAPLAVLTILTVNGTTFRGVGVGGYGLNGSSDIGGSNVCSTISLAAGDYVEMQDYVVATSGTYKITADTRNQFSMAYVGE